MDHATCCRAAQLIAGHPFDRGRAPVGAHIRKDLGGIGQQVAKQHGGAVQAVILGGKNKGWTDAVPIEGRVEHGFHEIAIGEWSVHWRWPWKPPRMALCPRASSPQSSSARRGLPIIRSRAIMVILTTVSQSLSFWARVRCFSGGLYSRPSVQLAFVQARARLKFLRIVNALFDAAGNFTHIDRFHPHAQVAFEEGLVDDRTGNAHRNASQ